MTKANKPTVSSAKSQQRLRNGSIPARYDIVVGVDPDADKSGVAELNVATRTIQQAGAMAFPDMVDYLQRLNRRCEVTGQRFVVVIEAGWLNKGHWHVGYNDSRQKAAALGNGVGRNQQTGILLGELCRHWQMATEEVRPLPLHVGKVQMWKGKEGKITAEELETVTGYSKRTNQEARDAALLAWSFAGLPLRIGVK